MGVRRQKGGKKPFVRDEKAEPLRGKKKSNAGLMTLRRLQAIGKTKGGTLRAQLTIPRAFPLGSDRSIREPYSKSLKKTPTRGWKRKEEKLRKRGRPDKSTEGTRDIGEKSPGGRSEETRCRDADTLLPGDCRFTSGELQRLEKTRLPSSECREEGKRKGAY